LLPLFDSIKTRRFPLVTYALIATNFAVWYWELGARGSRIDHDAFYPCALHSPCIGVAQNHLWWPISVVTAMFLHASWVHILGNMLFLWIFGNNVEDALGRLRFLVFYVAAGFVAALTQTYVTIHWSAGPLWSVPNVGASGAIAGVLGAYFVLFPRARIWALVVVIPWRLSAWFFLGFWFLFELWEGGFSLTHPQSGGGVAFAAHVGGFVFGVLAVKLFQRVGAPADREWRSRYRR
jgi:membrane associated rhomboid family serine protease